MTGTADDHAGDDRAAFRLGSMPIGSVRPDPASPAMAGGAGGDAPRPEGSRGAGDGDPRPVNAGEVAAASGADPAGAATSAPAVPPPPPDAAAETAPAAAAAPSEPITPAPAEPAPKRRAPAVAIAGAVALLLPVALASLLPGIDRLPQVPGGETATVDLARRIAADGLFAAIVGGIDPRASLAVAAIQGAVATITGAGAAAPLWLFRSVSAFAAILAILLVAAAGFRLRGPLAGLVTGLFLTLALLTGIEARLAGPDAAMLAAAMMTFYGLAGLAAAPAAPGRAAIVLFWLGLGTGLAIGGLSAIWVPLLALLVLVVFGWSLARLGRLRPGIGLPAALVIGLLPALAVAVAAGPQAAVPLLGGDFVARVVASFSLAGDGLALPPGAHALVLAAGFWPGSALLPFALGWLVRQRTTPAAGLALAWLAPAWLVVELVVTKRAADPLLLYPVLALLLGLAASDAALRLGSRLRGLMAAWLPFGAVGLAVAFNAVHVLVHGRIEPVALAASFLGAAGTIAGWRALVAGELRLGLACGLLGAAVIFAAGFGLLLGGVDAIWPAAIIGAAF